MLRAYGLPIVENAEWSQEAASADITAGNNAFGAWAVVHAAIRVPLIITRVQAVCLSGAAAPPAIIEIGWGPSGAEVPIGQVAVSGFSTTPTNPSTNQGPVVIPALAFPTIPAGARVVARAKVDGAGGPTWSVNLGGVRADLAAGTGLRQARPGDLIGITWDDIILSTSYQTLDTTGTPAALITDIAVLSGEDPSITLAVGPAGAEHSLCTIFHYGGNSNDEACSYPLTFPVFLPGGARLSAKDANNAGDAQIAVGGLRLGTSPQDSGAYGSGEGFGRYRIR